MSKIVRFHELADADVLKIEDLPLEEPGPNEVKNVSRNTLARRDQVSP